MREHLLIMDGVSSAVCEWRQMDSGSLFPLRSMRQLLSAYDERTRQSASASLRIVLVRPHARTTTNQTFGLHCFASSFCQRVTANVSPSKHFRKLVFCLCFTLSRTLDEAVPVVAVATRQLPCPLWRVLSAHECDTELSSRCDAFVQVFATLTLRVMWPP